MLVAKMNLVAPMPIIHIAYVWHCAYIEYCIHNIVYNNNLMNIIYIAWRIVQRVYCVLYNIYKQSVGNFFNFNKQ